MQQFKRPPKPTAVPAPALVTSQQSEKEHLANITTQIVCTFISTYSAPHCLGSDQINAIVRNAYKMARHIQQVVEKEELS